MYTSLSSLISLSLNHHLYVDDTQLFFSFHPPVLQLKYHSPLGCSSADLHLDGHKSFNSTKTEFLLIGLKKQLAKIHNSSINTTQSAHNLGFIFLPIFRSLHWLKITKRIEYRHLLLTFSPQHSLLITCNSCSSTYIIFSTNN